MKYAACQTVYGFRVCSAEKSIDPAGNTFLMEHERTGARLFWLDNGAENMVFSIAFRTPPEDSTGVFHILEHSVLNGSGKYPIKEPFVELLKTSMNTFLNAMTFPDMTLYPVSSRNVHDLMNLTSVYLDAVFDPVSMKDPKRFQQEGWHIDRDENGKPEYRGVVLNEMKGALSDTDTLIENELNHMLFPDTFNGFNSGGDPEEITDLTWEKYRDQYKRCYHPSNAWVYLDGAVPMDEMLPLLDSYFSAYEKRENNPEFSLQEPKGSESTIQYELGQDEETRNKSFLTIARITGTWKDRTVNMARGILCDVLTGTNESPLKREVLEKGLAKDLNLTVDDTGLQSWTAIHAEHVTDGKEKEIFNLLEKYGNKIIAEGLDRKAVEASMNRAVYHLREEEEPQGIGRCIRCMGIWLYGGDPVKSLECESMIRELHQYLENGTFDRLAADMLLNRENAVVLHSVPSHVLGEEKRAKEAEKLSRKLEKMTDSEREEWEKQCRELETWQCTPDREEDLASLPVLNLEDADIEPEWTGTETETVNGVPIMIHQIPCNGVVHLRAYFRLTDLTLDELTKAALFAGMLGKLPTKKYNAFLLQQEIKRLTGSLGFIVTTFRSKDGREDHCVPYLVAFASTLEDNVRETQELMAEILSNTIPEGQQDRIRDIMMQFEIGARQQIISAGHSIAVKKCLSIYSAEGAAKNATDGERSVQYIHRFAANPEIETKGFLQTARKILENSICKARMLLSVTAGINILPDLLANAFREGSPAAETVSYHEDTETRIGFRIPAQTGFAARGYRLGCCGIRFSGSLWLASGILTLGYYWNKVRVQGGAYGAGIQIDRSGNIFSYSYRDPTPAKSLAADSEAGEFLLDFSKSRENLDRHIISALNELNPLLSPKSKGALADARILTGYTREESERIRKEVLNTTSEQLAACGECFDRFAEEGSVCVVAHGDALQQCGGLEIQDL